MYFLSCFVKETVPNYLAGLPIPDSFGGWFRLGVRDWLALIPPTVVIGGISYYSYHSYQTVKQARAFCRINPMIRLDEKKVVDFVEIEDIGEKMSLCRCWRSKKWPLCDGAHGPHNRATGDNAGPVVIRRSKPTEEKK